MAAPVRSCVGCRTRRPADELVRLTRRASPPGSDEPAVHRAGGPSDGRGAWLCRASVAQCGADAIRHRRFERAWRVSLADEDHRRIEQAIRELTSDAAGGAAIRDASGGDDAAVVGMTTGKG